MGRQGGLALRPPGSGRWPARCSRTAEETQKPTKEMSSWYCESTTGVHNNPVAAGAAVPRVPARQVTGRAQPRAQPTACRARQTQIQRRCMQRRSRKCFPLGRDSHCPMMAVGTAGCDRPVAPLGRGNASSPKAAGVGCRQKNIAVYNAAIRLRRISGVRFRRTQLAALAPSYMSSPLQKFWYLDLQQR
jgi:hypothetical protein